MSSPSRSPRDQKTNSLRLKLKRWEHDFASRNGGRRPSQDDIRQNTKIASHYRKYHKLRQVSKVAVPPITASHSNIRGERFYVQQRPVESLIETPSLSSEAAPLESDLQVRIESNKYFNTEKIKATPQKNGKVLGIFDTSLSTRLPPQISMSPSRTTKRASANFPSPPLKTAGIPSTPSKTIGNKCFNLADDFITPSKRRKTCDNTSKPVTTNVNVVMESRDSSYSDDLFNTPHALRSNHLNSEVITKSPASPSLSHCIPNLLPRKPPLKGLTSIIAELRRVEDENFADDDVLRSIHSEDKAEKRSPALGKQVDGSLEHPSQAPGSQDSDDETLKTVCSPGGKMNRVLKVAMTSDDRLPVGWKKKGLKRQSRRTVLRPTQLSTVMVTSKHTKLPQVGTRKAKEVANFQKLKLKKARDLRQRWPRNRH